MIERQGEALNIVLITNVGPTILRAYFEPLARLDTAAVAERFKQLRAGNPNHDPHLGPMINQAQQRRVNGYLEKARSEGLAVAAAGAIADDVPAGGYYVAPTFLARPGI